MAKQFFLKFQKKGKTYFVDGATYEKTGAFKFVSAEKVKRAKKKVVNYSLKEKRVLTTPKATYEKAYKTDFGKEVINTDILSQSINKLIVNNYDNAKKIGIKYKGQIREINVDTPEKLKELMQVTNDIQTAYFNAFKGLTDSPILFVGYTEGTKGAVINYDDTLIGEDGEIQDEFPDEYRAFRQKAGRILSKYFK